MDIVLYLLWIYELSFVVSIGKDYFFLVELIMLEDMSLVLLEVILFFWRRKFIYKMKLRLSSDGEKYSV